MQKASLSSAARQTVYKLGLLISVYAMMSACTSRDMPGVKECESFLKSQLRSPSTYSRVSLTTNDLPNLRPAQFRGITYQDPPDGVTGNVGLLLVKIEYDAANAYGTPVRETGKCAFPLVEGNIYDLDGLRRTLESPELRNLKLSTSNLREVVNEAERQSGKDAPPKPIYDCCIDW